MGRYLEALFRRDPSRDRTEKGVFLEGYAIFWPDGSPVTLGLDAFCSHGQRLLGLGELLAGQQERRIDLLIFPQVTGRENMTRLPGRRVRRFFFQREGDGARVHFMDGTPTSIVFDLVHDDERVLEWFGLLGLDEGQRRWFDLSARGVEERETVPELAIALAGGYVQASPVIA